MVNLSLKSDFHTLYELTVRNIKVFVRDRTALFFSMLSPLIVFGLFVLFLGDIQVDTITNALEGLPVDEKLVKAYVNSWLISGVLGTGAVTVALSSISVMVADKQNKVYFDFLASPIKKCILMPSYYLATASITFIICFCVLIVGLIYLAATGSFYLSAGDVFGVVGVLFVSVLSSTSIVMLIVGFFKSENGLGAFTGIVSAVLGFLIGAYMPISIFPKAIQYVANLIPGSHSTTLLRQFLMTAPLNEMTAGMPAVVRDEMADYFSMDIYLFDKKLSPSFMWLYLLASIIVFGALVIFAKNYEKKKK